jgi:DNA-binding NarL/FixJ family response regulator
VVVTRPAAPIRVVVADDQRAVRESLATVLDLEPDITVVGTAADGDEAVTAAVAAGADVVLMDLRMPGVDGVAATRRLAGELPSARVVVLTTYTDDASVADALRAGAIGYLTKDAGRQQIALAVRAAASGHAILDPAVQAALLRGGPAPTRPGPEADDADAEPPDGLTPRELEVLRSLAAGRTNAEIARDLYIAEVTVKSHINHLFTKTGARNRADAVRYAYRHHLVDER